MCTYIQFLNENHLKTLWTNESYKNAIKQMYILSCWTMWVWFLRLGINPKNMCNVTETVDMTINEKKIVHECMLNSLLTMTFTFTDVLTINRFLFSS